MVLSRISYAYIRLGPPQLDVRGLKIKRKNKAIVPDLVSCPIVPSKVHVLSRYRATLYMLADRLFARGGFKDKTNKQSTVRRSVLSNMASKVTMVSARVQYRLYAPG
ncbi:hypothetical protein AVEN_109548-1 [Araneus ventricosus]|uniref:Uncharacterized protein n=1 Tax=Araneus ventricosus TaxID=182803 RepID=A0A4Y2UIL5_ARAVE|nr:hypothetical protein AVEN_109548-1 [Araneus ventricosus]